MLPRETPHPKWLAGRMQKYIHSPSSYSTATASETSRITLKSDHISIRIKRDLAQPRFDSPFKDAGYDVRDYKRWHHATAPTTISACVVRTPPTGATCT